MSPEVAVALRPAPPENSGPTQTQRACLRLPCTALSAANLNTECPSVPHPAPRSDGLEMRSTGKLVSSGPVMQVWLLLDRDFTAVDALRLRAVHSFLDVSTVLHRCLRTRRHCPYRAKDSSIEFRMGRRRKAHIGKAQAVSSILTLGSTRVRPSSWLLESLSQNRTGRQKADFAAKLALAPRSSSMRMSGLYFSTRSPRQGAPVLRWPVSR